MLLAPPEWTRRAACQGLTSGDWDPWTPDVDSSFQWAVARRVCARCPVRLDCALDAIAQLEDVAAHSMRGGLTPVELKRVAHRLDQPTRLRAAHGSRSRYVAGCRCSRCRHAHAVYEHDRRLHQSAKEGAGQRPRTLTQRVVNALSTTAPRSAREIAGRLDVKTKAVRQVLDRLLTAGTAVAAGDRDGAILWARGVADRRLA